MIGLFWGICFASDIIREYLYGRLAEDTKDIYKLYVIHDHEILG